MNVILEPQISVGEKPGLLNLSGAWNISHASILNRKLNAIFDQQLDIKQIDCADIEELDSAGALLLVEFLAEFKKRQIEINLSGLNERYLNLLQMIIAEDKRIHQSPNLPLNPNWFYLLGVWATEKYCAFRDFLAFIGESATLLVESARKPLKFYWDGIIQTIDDVGYQALGIVALLSFLVGIVLTYQIAIELKTYGANIYIVDITGLIILREFGPLITAIIAGGRTSTSFTAQIGTMKVNEEIDALRTMGVSPIQRLVLPKMIGALIAIPLLTVWADIFGVLGSMFMSKTLLGIQYYSFLHRFQHAIEVRHYISGLIKTPVFAILIAAVGCFQGFQVASSADSVGRRTTQAAVQSIFLIIIADAIFSVLFSWRGL